MALRCPIALLNAEAIATCVPRKANDFCGNVWPAFQEVLFARRADSALQKRGLNHLHLFYKQFTAFVINPGAGRIAISEATAIAASDQNGDDQWRGKRLFLTNAF